MAKKGKKGAKAGARPAWMSEAMYALSQSPAQLMEHFKGGTAGDKASAECAVTREQAGLLLWQLLWPSDKKAKAKRDEAVKADLLETAAQALGSSNLAAATPAAGLLALIADADCEAVLSAKPAVIPALLRALAAPSTSLQAAAASLLRALATAPEARGRVLRACRDVDWRPMLAVSLLQREVGPLGSRLASIESAQAFEALLQLPGPGEDASERVLVEAAHAAFVTAGGVETMLRVAGNNGPPASAGAAAACVMSAFRSHGAAAHGAFAAAHGPAAMVRVMRNPYVSLPHRAAAAGVLWHYIVPDQPGTGRGKGASSKKAAAGGSAADVDQEDGHTLVLERALLQPGARDKTMQRCADAAAAGAIPLLVQLCAGPDGPLPDRDGMLEAVEDSAKQGKKGKKGGKKAKKAKLEPGMAEAQTYAAGCLRLISLDEAHKAAAMRAGAARYLPGLLDSKVHLARWHARQALLNLAMVPPHARELARYGVPPFVTGRNVPTVQLLHRPQTAPAAVQQGGDFERLRAEAAAARGALQSAK